MINLKNKKVILTGCKGQLGSKITEIYEQQGAVVCGFDIDDFDLRNKGDVLSNYRNTFDKLCGVDILNSHKGPLVIEANLSPGLQGIKQATNIDVADKIAKYLYIKTKEYSLIE